MRLKNYFWLALLFAPLICSGCSSSIVSTPVSFAVSSTESTAVSSPAVSQTVTVSDEFKSFTDACDFTAKWQRTNVYEAEGATIDITNQNAEGFDIEFWGVWALHTGYLKSSAKFVSKNKAICVYRDEEFEDSKPVNVIFSLQDNALIVNVSGDEEYLGFGANVSIDGEYTKDKPEYLHNDIVKEVFGTKETQSKFKKLLGEKNYKDFEDVFYTGFPFDVDGLTYSGFVAGGGIGADVLIKGDKIYCCLNIGDKLFFTNDENYKDKLPPVFQGEYYNDYSIIYKDV